jgi:histidinol-phosphate aminotransferase
LVFLTRSLRNLGFQVVPSAANFIMLVFADPPQAKHVFEVLLSRGVIVRPLAPFGLPRCLRVSVGTPEENEIFVNEMEANLYANRLPADSGNGSH